MARLFRDRGTLGDSNRHSSSMRFSSSSPIPKMPSVDLPSPYGDLGVSLPDPELRETAYEIFVAACRTTGGKPLTYIPQSERTPGSSERSLSSSASSISPSLQRSLTSTAASKMKKALGIKSSKKSPAKDGTPSRRKQMTVGELMRIQMGVSEQTDSRMRRGLLRIAASQVRKLGF